MSALMVSMTKLVLYTSFSPASLRSGEWKGPDTLSMTQRFTPFSVSLDTASSTASL